MVDGCRLQEILAMAEYFYTYLFKSGWDADSDGGDGDDFVNWLWQCHPSDAIRKPNL